MKIKVRIRRLGRILFRSENFSSLQNCLGSSKGANQGQSEASLDCLPQTKNTVRM